MAGLPLFEAGHKNKVSRSQRTISNPEGVILFSFPFVHGGGQEKCSISIRLLLLIAFCGVWSWLSLLVACMWERQRHTHTLATLWAIPSRPSKCAVSSNCCLIGSEMLFSGLTIYKGCQEGSTAAAAAAADFTASTSNAYENLSELIAVFWKRIAL